ncbi:protein-S-isoprenylcysteine O-methyltransferase Ste14 [Dyadobacter arcticus]|uniref:Protein-S-isoprenylcysteine O-methyltransferase Ste14 n=1 Tax=Dyadobacter arcticus TaxID=1078754 RepID=A0ABX0UIE4_9BACT|nr:protein-S-isoprenylcysteine O-methyltransferase Ste14 [Dyadobacter arcticus]
MFELILYEYRARKLFLLLIPLLIVVQKGIIEREEAYLTRKFGNDYMSYQPQVRRWF